MGIRKLFFSHAFWVPFISIALLAGPAQAVDQLGFFELDGNAIEQAAAGDDWATLHIGGGSAAVFTGVNDDPAPMSIFTGGRKDIQDIDKWGHKSGAVPDKSDITNAYAAAYDNNGELIVYFGADRIANAGDTFLGFWFFKAGVTMNANGSFNGLHTDGDTLVLVNFPQSANAVPLVQVVVWDPSCSKADSNVPSVGQCAAQNLRLMAGVSGPGAVCNPAILNQDACAISNLEGSANAAPGVNSTAPWPYISKDGTNGEFPYETFFEGGINLSKLIGGDACFSSFMAETRSSSSFTASLKDFVLDAFPVCSISVTKSCTNPQLNADDTITYSISGAVTNDGFGNVYNIGVTDSPAFDAPAVFAGDPATLGGGDSINYSATMTVPLAQNGTMDEVTATANTQANDNGSSLVASKTATCPSLQISPALSLTKDCDASVAVENLQVVAKVTASGEVCNIGDSRIDMVYVNDDKAGTLLGPVSLAKPDDPLDPDATAGACMSYSGTYTPTEANDINDAPTTDPEAVLFKDTATATGVDILGAPLTPQMTMASCPLCE